MKHLVQFSTGAGSAEVAFRVYAKHGPDDTVLITADTMVEDDDNWRFARECVAQMPGVEWTVLRDGRTPMQVGMDERVVPNNRFATCSRRLKRDLIRRYMNEHYDPADSIVYLGFDWTEEHRMVASYEPWKPWTIEAPPMEPPYLTKVDIIEAHRALGIEPVRLYEAGFSHANCGGACVRGGQAQWRLLLTWDRERYLEWERDEEAIREHLDKNVSILRDRRGGTSKPLPLRVFRNRLEGNPDDYDADEWGACGCTLPDADERDEIEDVAVTIGQRPKGSR